MADAVNRHRFFFHDLQKSGLRLRRRAIDFIRHQDIREDRAGSELKTAGLEVEDVRADDIGGHQIRRELDSLAIHLQKAGDGSGGERLGSAGHAFEQDVPAANQCQQDHLHVFSLTDDDPLRPIQQRID